MYHDMLYVLGKVDMEETIAYLDNAATTRPCPEAVQAVMEAMERGYGNPSSLHRLGAAAARAIAGARESTAALLGCKSECVYFTSGGSESNNMALLGAANARRGRHIVTTAVEHSSVSGPLQWLESQGWEVTSIPPGPNGELDAGRILGAVRPDTAFISMMMVNNETGAVFPVEEIARKGKRAFPRLLIHCDGVQAFGKLPLRLSHTEIDLFSASGHKIQGPKGSGLLYIRQGLHIAPFIRGGGQEKGMRSGTENVPMIAGFGAACQKLLNRVQGNYTAVRDLRDLLWQKLLTVPQVQVLSPEKGSPYILNFSIPGYRGETMLHYLESKNIFVSSGSACSKGAASPVLSAMGLPKPVIDGALRVSFIYNTSREEVERLVPALTQGLESIAHG